MKFLHQDPEFADLLRIVSREAGLSPGLIEKDYWVTHTLWAIHRIGLDIWFKGGTSLSKGFGIIRRFSEDIDLHIEPGRSTQVPRVRSWKSQNKGPIEERRGFFEALARTLVVPQAKVVLNPSAIDARARGAGYRIQYPGLFLQSLPPSMRTFVLLEVGVARVTPFVSRTLSSFVHDSLARTGVLAGFTDNRPQTVRCVHPLVTLIEKLDAISRRHTHVPLDAASFIRHYEDAASIIAHLDRVPPLSVAPGALIEEMLADRTLARRPTADDPAFVLAAGPSREILVRAHQAIQPMFWGPRKSLADSCKAIRAWLAKHSD